MKTLSMIFLLILWFSLIIMNQCKDDGLSVWDMSSKEYEFVTVKTVSPPYSQIGYGTNVHIAFQFSQSMNTSTFIDSLTIKTDVGTVDLTQYNEVWTANNKAVELIPITPATPPLLKNRVYSIFLTNANLRSESGNPMEDSFHSAFATGNFVDVTPPSLVSHSLKLYTGEIMEPPDTIDAHSINSGNLTGVEFVFTESMVPQTVEDAFSFTVNGTAITPDSVSWTSLNRIVTFNFSNLPVGLAEINFANSVSCKDSAGNAITAGSVINAEQFVLTGSANSPQNVVSTFNYPATGSVGAAFNGDFTLTNAGAVNGASTITWAVYISNNAVFDATDTLVQTGTTPALNTGATSPIINYNGTWPATPSTYYLIVVGTANDSVMAEQISNPIPFGAVATPTSPTGVTATDYSVAGQVDISWNAVAGATNYTVYRSNVSGGPYSTLIGTTAATTLSDNTAVADTIYYYVVMATNAGGNSLNSVEDPGAFTNLAPAQPTGVTSTQGTVTGKVTVSWNAVTGATSYNISRAYNTGGPYTLLGSVNNPAVTFDDTTACPGVKYYYVVSTTNINGTSFNSLESIGWVGYSSKNIIYNGDAGFSSGVLGTSTDGGINWTTINFGRALYALDGNNAARAVSNGRFSDQGRYTTNNGVSWTATGGWGIAYDCFSIVLDNSGNALAFRDNNAGNQSDVKKSSNGGVTWTNAGVLTGGYYRAAATDNTGRVVAVASNNGAIRYKPMTGGGWTASTSFTGSGLNGIATDGGGRWVAVGDAGAIGYSLNNGVSFTATTNPAGGNLFGVATDGAGNWVAVGASGKIIYSSDWGITFTQATSFTGQQLNSVATDGAGFWVAVGRNGKIGFSNDNGVTWTAGSSGTTKHINNVLVQ